MKRKIIGVTVGTPTSPKKIEKEIKPIKTVNGNTPDENGNVNVVGAGGSLNITDDGKGNVIIETIGNGISITDDGNGNVVIR